MYPGPVERACKKFRRFVCGKTSPTYEKHLARRQYRHFNRLRLGAIMADPEVYYGETFQAPFLSSWDLW